MPARPNDVTTFLNKQYDTVYFRTSQSAQQEQRVWAYWSIWAGLYRYLCEITSIYRTKYDSYTDQ